VRVDIVKNNLKRKKYYNIIRLRKRSAGYSNEFFSMLKKVIIVYIMLFTAVEQAVCLTRTECTA